MLVLLTLLAIVVAVAAVIVLPAYFISTGAARLRRENRQLREHNDALTNFVDNITQRLITEASVDPALLPMSQIFVDEFINLRKGLTQ